MFFSKNLIKFYSLYTLYIIFRATTNIAKLKKTDAFNRNPFMYKPKGCDIQDNLKVICSNFANDATIIAIDAKMNEFASFFGTSIRPTIKPKVNNIIAFWTDNLVGSDNVNNNTNKIPNINV